MRPARRGPASAARSSATVRIVLMRRPPGDRSRRRPAPAWPSTSASNSGSRSAARSAIAARWRGDGRLVAAGDRPGERPLGPERGPVLDRRPHERDEQLAVDAGGAGEPLGGRLERDEEVRRDRGGGVVGGAVVVGDLDRPQPERGRELARRASSARGVLPGDRRAGAGELGRRAAVTVISGCSENASCGRERRRARSRPSSGRRAGPGRSGPRPRRSRRRARTAARRRRRRRRAPRPSGPSTS